MKEVKSEGLDGFNIGSNQYHREYVVRGLHKWIMYVLEWRTVSALTRGL